MDLTLQRSVVESMKKAGVSERRACKALGVWRTSIRYKAKPEDPVNELVFDAATGNVSFQLDSRPVLGMGEGGPRMGRDWREEPLEFDRRGRVHEMVPRWQAQAYGSRNPVALLVGTGGWGLYVAAPWVRVDLESGDRGIGEDAHTLQADRPGEALRSAGDLLDRLLRGEL